MFLKIVILSSGFGVLCCIYLLVYPHVPVYTVTHANTDIKTTCTFPRLDPWDISLLSYMTSPDTFECMSKSSPIYIDINGYIRFNTSVISQYSLTSLKCVYHLAQRVDGDNHVAFDRAVSFVPPFFVPGRQFRVICKNINSEIVYDYVHFNIAWNESQKREDAIGSETNEQLSIIFVSIDSTSRSQALRMLPLSYKYLTENLKSYDFKGYMKVGRNSFPNLIPLFTGLSSSDLFTEITPNTYLDSVPFIWKDMAKAGYVTLYDEDRARFTSMSGKGGGFNMKPVDYYYRPCALAMNASEPVIVQPLGRSTTYCYGSKKQFDLQIDYLKRYIIKYTKRLKFSVLWSTFGHDAFLSVGHCDRPLFDFLQWMNDTGHLERTLLIVGSDHGFRLGGPAPTNVGRLENNMPFMTIYVPEILKSKHSWMHEHLIHNTQQLVTAYDVHATMKDILNRNFVDAISPAVSESTTGRSLLNRIPPTRTCQDAGVPTPLCFCDETLSVNLSYPLLQSLLVYTVDHMNDILAIHANVCEILRVVTITDAKVMLDIDRVKVFRQNKNNHIPGFLLQPRTVSGDSGRYIIMFYTTPGFGSFEAMLDFQRHGQEKKITIIGDPIRLNRYWKESHCVTSDRMKRYCYCSDLL